MWKLSGNKKTTDSLAPRERIRYIILLATGLLLITATSYDLFALQQEYADAQEEYAVLSERFSAIATVAPSMLNSSDMQSEPSGSRPDSASQQTGSASQQPSSDSQPPESAGQQPDSNSQQPESAGYVSPGMEQYGLLAEFVELNSEFVGWISIDGLIDYPVVRGANNSHYTNTTFLGQANAAGAIFMDYRHTEGFDSPVCILYGHSAKDGSMFAPLHQYEDPAFLADNPYINVTALGGEVLIYRVFAAEVTDIWDSVYDFDYQGSIAAAAPADASNFLILSTCTDSADRDERFLVYAELQLGVRN